MRECEPPGVMKVTYNFLVVKKDAETIYLNFNKQPNAELLPGKSQLPFLRGIVSMMIRPFQWYVTRDGVDIENILS